MTEKVYKLRNKVLGKYNADTMVSLNNLVMTHINLKNYRKALTLMENLYYSNCIVYGERHKQTIESLMMLLKLCDACGETKRGSEIRTKLMLSALKNN